MRKLLRWLEAKFGRFAVPNVTIALILGQVFVMMVEIGRQVPFVEPILLIPSRVLSGEWWRLLTFLFNPPETSPLFAIFFWLLFYLFGTTLEYQWGTFRYNLYLTLGYLAAVAVAFVTPESPASNLFLYMSVFLAFAWLYPDFVINVFFILPVKIKWLALLAWLSFGLTLLVGGWPQRLQVIAATCNFLIFFSGEILERGKRSARRSAFDAKTSRASKRLVHKCRTCGLTSEADPRMSFRYCSKCDGQMCYCSEHIRDHEHVTKTEENASV